MDAVLHSSSISTWETPPEIEADLRHVERLKRWDLDPFCSRKNIPAKKHYTKADNGLLLPWDVGSKGKTRVFMNPPYEKKNAAEGQPGTEAYIRKAVEESLKAGVGVWGLIPGRLGTGYMQDLVLDNAAFIYILRGRLKFYADGVPSESAPFDSVICYWGEDGEETHENFVTRSQYILPTLGGRFIYPYKTISKEGLYL